MANQIDKINSLLTRGVEEIFVKKHLSGRLRRGDKLRVKFGIDPTGPKIHLGRAATLWKLREFQDLGHQLIIIIGDFTAQIGDPSDKLAKRPMLTREQIEINLKTYHQQLAKIIDIEAAEWRRNSEWLNKLSLLETAQLAESFSFQQMAARRNFKQRLSKNQDISLREFMYPLMQGYDSVAIKADVEVGGSDQLFNLLAGRQVQKHYGLPEQDIMTTQMLKGTDGRKMSTSWGNVITIMDKPDVMYGQAMSIKDELIPEYLLLTTRLTKKVTSDLVEDLRHSVNPRDIKTRLAYELVKLYHGVAAAVAAQTEFALVHQKKQLPTVIPAYKLLRPDEPRLLVGLLVELGLAPSKTAARRLIEQSGVKINRQVVTDWQAQIKLKKGDIIQVGNRKFKQIV